MAQMVRIGTVAATVGGAAWTVKSLVIIAMNGHFQPIEGVLYFIGVGGIAVGALGLGAFVAGARTGASRWALFVVTIAVALFVTAMASSYIQTAVGDSYPGDNVGIEDEVGILVPGVIWLGVGILLIRRTRATEPEGRPAAV